MGKYDQFPKFICVWWTRGGLGQQLGIQSPVYEQKLNTPCCVYLKCSGNVSWHSGSFLFKFHWNCDPAFVLWVTYTTIYLGKRVEKWWRGRRAGGRLTNMNKLHEFVQTQICVYISQLPIIVLGIICSLFALFWYFWMLVKSFWLSCMCFSSSFVQTHCFPAYDLLATRYPFFFFFFFPERKCLSLFFSYPTPSFPYVFFLFFPPSQDRDVYFPFGLPLTSSSFFFFSFFLLLLLFVFSFFIFPSVPGWQSVMLSFLWAVPVPFLHVTSILVFRSTQ